MRKLLLTLFISSFSFFAMAQQSKLDSLLTIWNDEDLTDSLRLAAVHQIAFDVYLYRNADSALNFAQKQLDFAQSKGLEKDVALAINTQGNAYMFKGELVEALLKFRRSLAIRIKIDDKKGIAGSFINIGGVYSTQGQPAKAIHYLKKGIVVCDQIGEKHFKANALTTIAFMYMQQKDYDRSLEYYGQALDYFKEVGHINTYFAQQAIGSMYADLGEYDKALSLFRECLSISRSDNNVLGISSGLGGIGYVYQKQGKLDDALDYYLQSKKLMEELGHSRGVMEVIVAIGSVYIDANKGKEAIEVCNKGLNYSVENNNKALEQQVCECLYKAHKLNGDGFLALSFHERMKDLDDSLREEETAEKLLQMEFNNKVYADSIATVEREKAISVAHQEEVNKKNKVQNILIGAGLLVLLLAGAIYSRLSYVRKAKGIIEKEKELAEHERARSDELLLNILPADVAEEIKATGTAEAQQFEQVSILFTDFKHFTQSAEKLSATQLVNKINTYFKAFDEICEQYGIEKIKTIGDAYMCATGLHKDDTDEQAYTKNLVKAALEMQEFLAQQEDDFEMRAGIHTGPVVAGIVGVKKFQYDIWGDTVNTASRMESHGEVGKVNISEATYNILRHSGLTPECVDFTFEPREELEIKGKGMMKTFFVSIKN